VANKEWEKIMKSGYIYFIYEKKGVVVVTNIYSETIGLSKEGFKFIFESSSKNEIAKIISRDIKPAALIAEDEILEKVLALDAHKGPVTLFWKDDSEK